MVVLVDHITRRVPDKSINLWPAYTFQRALALKPAFMNDLQEKPYTMLTQDADRKRLGDSLCLASRTIKCVI